MGFNSGFKGLKQKLLWPSAATLGFGRWMIQVNCMLHDIKNVDP